MRRRCRADGSSSVELRDDSYLHTDESAQLYALGLGAGMAFETVNHSLSAPLCGQLAATQWSIRIVAERGYAAQHDS